MHRSPTSPIRRLIIGVVIVVTAGSVIGCSRALGRPMPDAKGPISLRVSPEPFGFGQRPVTVYQIPDTSVYVTGHEGAAGIGALFGPIGVALAIAGARSTAERKTEEHRAHLGLDVPKLTERALEEALQRRGETGRFGRMPGPAVGSLEITPCLVLNYVGDDHVRPWIVLRTVLRDRGGAKRWKSKYAAGVDETRPLGGERGWASDDGAPLRNAVDRNLGLAIDALLQDASATLRPGVRRMVTVRAQWVWTKDPSEETAEVLRETDDELVVIPQVADGQFYSGVTVLDEKSIVVAPAER